MTISTEILYDSKVVIAKDDMGRVVREELYSPQWDEPWDEPMEITEHRYYNSDDSSDEFHFDICRGTWSLKKFRKGQLSVLKVGEYFYNYAGFSPAYVQKSYNNGDVVRTTNYNLDCWYDPDIPRIDRMFYSIANGGKMLIDEVDPQKETR